MVPGLTVTHSDSLYCLPQSMPKMPGGDEDKEKKEDSAESKAEKEEAVSM